MSRLSKEPVCREEDRLLINIGTVYRVISSFIDAKKFWFIESVWKPDLLFEFPVCRKKPLESSESFDRTIAEVKQTTMFSVMADEATDVSNRRKPSLVLRYVDSSKNIREEFSGVRHC